jgi:glycosyltransferase involved in cell wall biosynthesis
MNWPSHIAIDGSSWGGQERGVAVATRRLWAALTGDEASAAAGDGGAAAMASVLRPGSGKLNGVRRIAWQQFALPRLVRSREVDLLCCPSYTAPLGLSSRLLVFVHDLIAWTHPRLAGWGNVFHLRLLVGEAVRQADAVCVPTETVRRAVLDRFGVRGDKLFVVPWGCGDEIAFVPRDLAQRQVGLRFAIDEPFVLFCGCLEPKKNVAAAIRACAEAGILLVIVGPSIPGSAAQLAAGGTNGARWRYLGYVSPGELSALYSCASLLLFPTIVEGFGIPLVEAMACRCPVVTSTAEAVREVCGNAAIHVPADDLEALARSVRLVCDDRALRDEMVGRGAERAASFTWAAAAERFRDAIGHASRPKRMKKPRPKRGQPI